MTLKIGSAGQGVNVKTATATLQGRTERKPFLTFHPIHLIIFAQIVIPTMVLES